MAYKEERDKWAHSIIKKEQKIHNRIEKTFNTTAKIMQEKWNERKEKRDEKFKRMEIEEK